MTPSFPTPVTLGHMLRFWARETPDQWALKGPDRWLTYAGLLQEVLCVAGRLREEGLGSGHGLGVLATRTLENVVLFLAAAEARASYVTLNPNKSPEEILSLCQGLQIRALAWEKRFEGTLALCRPGRIGIGLDHSPEKGWRYQDLSAPAGGSVSFEEACVDDIPYLNLTSGSSGDPKAAATSHRALYWNTRSTAEAMGFTQEEVFLCLFSPHAHPHELFCRTLYGGGTAILEPSTSPKKILAALVAHKVRSVMGVPSLYKVLAAQWAHAPQSHQLRLLEAGGAPSDSSLLEEVRAAFGIPLTPVWGSTETAGMALATPLGETPVPGAVGLPCPYYQAWLEPDENLGELVIDGEGLFDSYIQPDGASLKRTGPYRTGDLFRRDERGWFHFLGRQSSMIKVAGEKIHPERIETVLIEHPAVSEACVVGLSHETRGAIAVAFLAASGSERPTHSVLRRHCRAHLSPRETPKQFIWLEALPKLPSGKVDRKKLEAWTGEDDDGPGGG